MRNWRGDGAREGPHRLVAAHQAGLRVRSRVLRLGHTREHPLSDARLVGKRRRSD